MVAPRTHETTTVCSEFESSKYAVPWTRANLVDPYIKLIYHFPKVVSTVSMMLVNPKYIGGGIRVMQV